MVSSTSMVAVSTTETSFEGPLAVYKREPSGLKAIPHGRVPTVTELTVEPVVELRATTVPPLPVATYTRVQSGETATPIGLEGSPGTSIVVTTSWLEVSTTDTEPPFSAVT